MKSFKVQKVDMPYTEVEYSDWFDYSDIEFPKKIEVGLNIDNLEMGLHDGSALIVIFETTIDGVQIGQIPFMAVYLDESGEISQWLQINSLEEGDVDDSGKRVCLGNKGRFQFALSQATIGAQNPIPSKASFSVAVLVK